MLWHFSVHLGVLRSVSRLDAQPGAYVLCGRAGRSVTLEYPYDVSIALEAGARHWRVPVTSLWPVDIGTMGDQQLKHGYVVLFNCDHQRCHPRLIGSVFQDSPLAQQQLCNLRAAGISRRMERRETSGVARHYIGAFAE